MSKHNFIGLVYKFDGTVGLHVSGTDASTALFTHVCSHGATMAEPRHGNHPATPPCTQTSADVFSGYQDSPDHTDL